jgi:hypothetical protein
MSIAGTVTASGQRFRYIVIPCMYAANIVKRRESSMRPDCGGEVVRKMEPDLAVVECQK